VAACKGEIGMSIDLRHTRELLQAFDFRKLFTEELGWSRPTSKPQPIECGGRSFTLREVAQLGAKVFEVEAADGAIPDAKVRSAVHREVAKSHHEHLLIFVDRDRRQSVWSWTKWEGSKLHTRDHFFAREQPTDLIVSKLAGLHIDISELDEEGNLEITKVVERLQQALDVERVTKRFYTDYQEQHLAFVEHIEGISDERDRRWYASVLLNRLMFVYFLQKKGFIHGGDFDYLGGHLLRSQGAGRDLYYSRFLRLLFFEGFAKPEEERSAEARQLLGDVRYLNGGLFLRHRIEIENETIRIPDVAFENLLALFDGYSWSLDDTPGGKPDEINPDVLGYIFEKYINQKAFGAYYTRPEITEYFCEQTLHRLILDQMTEPDFPGPPGRRFESIGELLLRLDAGLCRKLLMTVLPSLAILDPACGSGAFLVAALRTLVNVYFAAIGKIETLKDATLSDWLRKRRAEHTSLLYFVKKAIVTDNLFGVDIMEEATEIARLRLFLALVSSTATVEDLEPLPNIDFNILTGNSLIGLLHVESKEFDATQGQGNLFTKSYRQLVAEKDREVRVFRGATSFATDLRALRDHIEELRSEARPTLDRILLEQFQAHKILFEQATWDGKEKAMGKAQRRPLTLADLAALQPFHWGYEFDQVLARGGFDAILTNPPWEAWKPQAKEFFSEHSDLVTKNKMTIKDFEKEQALLLRDPAIRAAWLEYLSRFPHVSLYFRKAEQYKNQIALVRGIDGKEKKAGTDVNLYKLFLEQCFNLLREGGRCGILLPTSVYTDLGAKQLRQMLFERTRIDALYGLSNERFLFEGVDHRFRICLLTFEKGGPTERFWAAFRIDPREAISSARLNDFLHDRAEHVELTVALVRRLSPNSLSLMELKSARDPAIIDKMLRFPLLGEWIEGSWNLRLKDEFHIRNDSALLHTAPAEDRVALFTGRMFEQFGLTEKHSGYWIKESDGQRKTKNESYRLHRWVYRRIARSSDTRTMISTISPRRVFTEVNSPVADAGAIGAADALVLCGISNSFLFDWCLRPRIDDTLSKFFLYQMPAPRLQASGPEGSALLKGSARLVCTTPEYADLWQEVMESPWSAEVAATDSAERATIRAELDGLVAHLYGIGEDEFSHVLGTFYNVPQETKDAALAAFRALAPKTVDPALAPLLLGGEGPRLEYKSTVRWDLRESKRNPILEIVILKTVAGFLNAQGGTLLLGVGDDGTPVGLEVDYQTLQKKDRDGFGLFLTDLLGKLGKDLAPCWSASFHRLAEHDVCRLEIAAAHRPVFVPDATDEAFWLRTGNSTRKLSGRELLAYEKARWHPAGGATSAPVAPTTTSPLSSMVHDPSPRPASPLENTPLFRPQLEMGERSPRESRSADDIEANEAMCAIRELFSSAEAREGLEREEALRALAHRLGFDRLGARIRETVDGHVTRAARRGIVATEAGILHLAKRSIGEYGREELREQLVAAAGDTWTPRDEAIRLSARRLGFRRTGNQIQAALTSALRGALQMGKLESDGDLVRRGRA
jgi:hypothetical protein